MASVANSMDISALIDNRGVGRFQKWTLAICFLISLVDGLDAQISSVTVPVMARDLNLLPSQLGLIFSASQLGALVGAFLFGFWADRWGRRPIVIFCTVLFSLGTFATMGCDSFATFLSVRFVTGLGIGGALPSYVALATEYSPRVRRGAVSALILSAIPCGGIMAGIIGATILGSFGWRFVFGFCGVISSTVCFIAILRLPESLSFMVGRDIDPSIIRDALSRLAPGEIGASIREFTISEEVKAGVPMQQLFTDGRLSFTILYGLGIFLTYFVLIGTLVWTPALLKQAGMSVGQASLVLSLNNAGAIVGALLSGLMIDRLKSGSYALIAVAFFISFAATSGIGYAAPSFWAAIFSAVSGCFLSAGSLALYAFATLTYPTSMRSSGIGWGSGLSRVGATLGPAMIGILVAAQWSVSISFVMIGAVSAINIVIIWLLGKVSGQLFPEREARS